MDAETGKRVALETFAANIDSPRTTHENSNGIWFLSETSLPSYSVEEVAAGFAATLGGFGGCGSVGHVTGTRTALDCGGVQTVDVKLIANLFEHTRLYRINCAISGGNVAR
mgnify:CR=1 FL=1